MAKRSETITLEDAKLAIRRGLGASISNVGGWCVFTDSENTQRYVVDTERANVPVAFDRVRTLLTAASQLRRSGVVLNHL